MRIASGVSLAAALGLVLMAGRVQAQNPSADQIIKSLQPTGGLQNNTRGIKPMAPTTEATAGASAAPHAIPSRIAPSQPPPAAAAATPTAAPSVNLTVEFATGSADLTPPARRTLDELGQALSSPQLSAYRFRIEGHTDTVGSADLNKALSERRAAAVATYLADHFNVATARLTAVGMGEDKLLVATPPQTAEPRNRRVQVVNIGA